MSNKEVISNLKDTKDIIYEVFPMTKEDKELSLDEAIKALEVVDKIKQAWRDEKYPEYFEEAVGEILKEAYKDWDSIKVDKKNTNE